MSMALLAPVLLPALAAVVLLFLARAPIAVQRAIGAIATFVSAATSVALLQATLGGTRFVVSMGDWPVPHGIVLVLDRLSGVMLSLTGLLALAAFAAASRGWDERGKNFHALFQFQLMGIHGAFLTGDIFNLFVFFEILLISSYGLMLHGGGNQRIRAGLRYVIVNLVGSTVFVVALGLVYGATGTLNMAGLAASDASGPVWDAAVLLLLLVFSIKAAAVPLHLWLPTAYGAASPPVACLFAILTKVGLYAILRVHGLVLGLEQATPLLLGLGIAGVVIGGVGALASRGLRDLLGWLVVGSVSTGLLALGIGGVPAVTAALYYALHSTLVTGALFLLAGVLVEQRGRDDFAPGPKLGAHGLLSVAFLVGAATFIGLPPTSGFLGKLAVLSASVGGVAWGGVFAAVLGGGLLGLLTMSRAGTALFWNLDASAAAPPPVAPARLLPIAWLLALGLSMVAAGGPVFAFAEQAAAQALDTEGYVRDVFAWRGGR